MFILITHSILYTISKKKKVFCDAKIVQGPEAPEGPLRLLFTFRSDRVLLRVPSDTVLLRVPSDRVLLKFLSDRFLLRVPSDKVLFESSVMVLFQGPQ